MLGRRSSAGSATTLPMLIEFVPKNPSFAYVSNRLWLPKSLKPGDGLIRPGPVKRALEFTVPARGTQEEIRLWQESSNHLICPREFLPPSEYLKYKFPVVDIRPPFGFEEFEDLVVPRSDEQAKAWNALALNDNGILNLGCGKGKTKLAVKKIAQMKTPTLVIVPDGGILEQWKNAILGGDRTTPGLRLNGELGLIQGPNFDWARPITLALVTTLGLRIRDGQIPPEMYRYFGLIVYDEVHQIGAPMFSLTAAPFYGNRIGLTATVTREDGLDPIYRYHIGEPFYTDLSQDLVPSIYFQQTPSQLPVDKAKVNGITNVSVLRTMLGQDYVANVYRYYHILEALKQGRKIICLSHSKFQLRLFHALFPGSGLIISETEKADRLTELRKTQVCFAIARLGSTGVDDDALDTLFWLTPFRSKISLQQSMGRIQRLREGKKDPVMVVFEDFQVHPLRKLCQTLKGNLREWGFKFETLKVSQMPFPQYLPPEVQLVYDRVFHELQQERIED